MVIDHLDNAGSYFGLGVRLAAGLRYLQETDLQSLAPGRYEIEGRSLFALVFEYQTKPREAAFWEAHRQYIDIQYVHSGVELIGYAPIALMECGPYDEGKDLLRAAGEGEFLELRAGFFAVLGPQDAHMPGIVRVEPQTVKKVVVKVAVDGAAAG
jgi:YhcH/YjgK/YiaL family protein